MRFVRRLAPAALTWRAACLVFRDFQQIRRQLGIARAESIYPIIIRTRSGGYVEAVGETILKNDSGVSDGHVA
jgi:hypothetical protein